MNQTKALVLGPFCCRDCGPRTRIPEWRVQDVWPWFVFHVAAHMDDERVAE